MSSRFSWPRYLAFFFCAAAVPSNTNASRTTYHYGEESFSTELFSLPMGHADVIGRENAITDKREKFLYGPSICGNVSYWPTGLLGNSTTEYDFAKFIADSQDSQAAVNLDETVAAARIAVCQVLKNVRCKVY
jgi:hypothetical protein